MAASSGGVRATVAAVPGCTVRLPGGPTTRGYDARVVETVMTAILVLVVVAVVAVAGTVVVRLYRG
jgi:hypothetical protein